MYSFKTSQELLRLCKKHQKSISEITIRYEIEYSQKKRSEILAKMRKIKMTLREAIKAGLKTTNKGTFGMAGETSAKLYKSMRRKRMIMPPMVIKAMAYAVATGESNAVMGRIAAFPTAGGAGVVPGVTIAAAEKWKLSEQRLLRGLFTASAVGKIIAENSTLSAAAGGCQAEVGAAVAMAAAALTEMRGGTPEQSINASALALKSYLGLVCDPLGGLVAVPCIKRNMMGASAAITASDASIAGVESFVPFDEVVSAMKNIAREMSTKHKETALGGLATTKTGLRIRKKIGLPDIENTN